ncbi:protein DpdF [Streptomyces sporangiiformans]|uniref:DNA 3'-5' helicase n=1 Tax=Streptomyces sporangiiformans TaxID=2315329 RepID=A0A505D717_9ACTN|nr:protein DpdF [Streptomyces sporangiiformans]TPQ18637.1 DEAD/DEAH box helicase [Streptomyces sporangiiformans]
MSEDAWVSAQRLLNKWPEVKPDILAKGVLRRLGDALSGLQRGAAGCLDVVALTRQLILHHQALGRTGRLSVPLREGLPTVDQWRQGGCDVVVDGSRVLLRGLEWAPVEDEGPAREAGLAQVREAVLGKDAGLRRVLEAGPADPFWTDILGYDHYLSKGQRQAARSVVLMPPGETLLVCLPTGHGKTPVALAGAMLAGRSSGVSLMVVPTVVLAIDMERRVRDLLSRRDPDALHKRYAYFGELNQADKEQMRSDISAGRQALVIASPEAVVAGLSKALRDAAQSGNLNYVILDEAHLVEQWGNEFRSEFQSLAAPHRAWREIAPKRRSPRTVAMSATLTEQQIATLRDLFGSSESTSMVWASELRSEPAYFLDAFGSEEQRAEAVLQAVACLPKPMVLYTSQKKHANEWAETLRAAGMQRVAVVHGDVNDVGRRRALEGWSGRTSHGAVPTEYDVVVGTSAFGLGVDLDDVRSVVHACVPETVDRYYQEVGRGGRDGSPSLAYLAAAPGDQNIAQSLNEQKILMPDTAWGRWRAMFTKGQHLHGDRYLLDLTVRPPRMSVGYATHKDWNVRLLNLLDRLGLVRTFPPTPPVRESEENSSDWQQRMAAHYETARDRIEIELVEGQTNDPEYFRVAYDRIRSSIKDAQRKSLRRMLDVLGHERCIANTLAEYFSVAGAKGGRHYTMAACRGCPFCRRQGLPSEGAACYYRKPLSPDPDLIEWPSPKSPLAHLHPQTSHFSIYWQDLAERKEQLLPVLVKLARSGVSHFAGPGVREEIAQQIQQQAPGHPVIVDHDGSLVDSGTTATVAWVADDTASPLEGALRYRLEDGDPLYLLLPRQVEDPSRPGVPFVTTHPSLNIQQVRSEFR